MKTNLHDSQLGKTSTYAERYDKSLLFRIERTENREIYAINPQDLPFVGCDLWNAYEVSFLTNNGLPVSCVMKMKYDAAGTYMVESKSLKLYLNSFNMEAFGKTQEEAMQKVKNTIIYDLSTLLETPVEVSLFTAKTPIVIAFPDYPNLNDLIDLQVLEALQFRHFTEAPELLKAESSDDMHHYQFYSDLLRSNCPVTNQPDWGDLFVYMRSPYVIDYTSIIAYLISFRKENHFHEEVAEMVFQRFQQAFKPTDLMIATMYTRRGGIDINPIRATHAHLIDAAFSNMEVMMGKNLRQ